MRQCCSWAASFSSIEMPCLVEELMPLVRQCALHATCPVFEPLTSQSGEREEELGALVATPLVQLESSVRTSA